jgi:hypothetical protein
MRREEKRRDTRREEKRKEDKRRDIPFLPWDFSWWYQREPADSERRGEERRGDMREDKRRQEKRREEKRREDNRRDLLIYIGILLRSKAPQYVAFGGAESLVPWAFTPCKTHRNLFHSEDLDFLWNHGTQHHGAHTVRVSSAHSTRCNQVPGPVTMSCILHHVLMPIMIRDSSFQTRFPREPRAPAS